jgi:hypothetical protein
MGVVAPVVGWTLRQPEPIDRYQDDGADVF